MLETVKRMLAAHGIAYAEDGGQLRLTVRCGEHPLETVITEDEECFLRCWARLPWRVGADVRAALLEELNAVNAGLRAGCAMILDDYVVFRYGAYIIDEYTAEEAAADLFVCCVAFADSCWGRVRAVLMRGEGSSNGI